MPDLTPEEIQQARELAIEVGDALGPDPAFLAHAVLVLTEQQPEPVSLAEFHEAMWSAWRSRKSHFADVVITIYGQFTLTRKEPTDG